MLNIKNVIAEARENETMLGCINCSWRGYFEGLADHLLGTYDVDKAEFEFNIGNGVAFFKVYGESVTFTAVRDWYGITKGFEIR